VLDLWASAHLPDVLGSAGVGLWAFELASQRVHWSRIAYEMHRIPPATPLSYVDVMRMSDPADHAPMNAMVERACRSGEAFELENQVTDPGGRTFWVRSRGKLIDSDVGPVLLGTMIDVTAQRETLARYEQQRAFVDRLLATLPDLVYVLDLASGQHVFTNRGALDVLGSRGDGAAVVGEPQFHTMVVDEDRPLLEAHIERMQQIGPGRALSVEYRIRDPRGNTRWIQSRDAWLESDERGELKSLIGVARDVTATRVAEQERRALEEQLAHQQRLQVIGQLAGGIAHDFNNLLMALHGFLDRVESGDAERRVEALERMRDVLDRARRLTTKLTTFGGAQPMHPQTVDVVALVGGLQGVLRELLDERIAFDVDVAAPPLWVVLDPTQLEQIVVNLVVNARDALHEGGTIRLRVGRDPGDGSVSLRVSDDGVGMSPEVQGKVFEPFFTTRASKGGTGLGLAIVRAAVRAAGGRIELQSSLGEGTEISVWFPSADAESRSRGDLGAQVVAPPRAAAAAAGAEPAPSLRVLLVEDDVDVRESLVLALRSRGFEVEPHASAESALRELEGAPAPDVLVTDGNLPGRSGGELARELRGRWPQLPVVVLSGYEASATANALPEGARFLGKPVPVRELVATVRSAVAATKGLAATR